MLRDIIEAVDTDTKSSQGEVAKLRRELESMHDYAKDLEEMIMKLESLKAIEDELNKEDAYAKVIGHLPGRPQSVIVKRMFNILHRHMGKYITTEQLYNYLYANSENPPDPKNIIAVQMSKLRSKLPPEWKVVSSTGSGYALIRVDQQGPQGS